MSGVHRKLALPILVLLGLSACVPFGSGEEAAGSTAPSTVDAASTTESAQIAPPTQPATTTQPPLPATTAPPATTLPPAPTATATQFAIPADAPDAVIESVSDVMTNDEGTAAFLVGTVQAGPGAPNQATVWVTDGRTRAATIALDLGGGEEAWASGVAVRGAQVLVAGTTRTGDRTTGVLWQSDDGGATFGTPQLINPELTALSDVAFGDQGLITIGAIQPAGQRSTPVVLTGSGDAWATTVLEGPGQRWARTVTVNGPAIFVTGGAEIDGFETALLWLSGDNGTKFSFVESVTTYREIGEITVQDGNYVTTGRGKNDDPMVILSSTNGFAWVPTEVRLTSEGQFYGSQYEGGERVVVAPDGSYVTEVGSGYGYIGRIAPDGRGEAFNIYRGRSQSIDRIIPFAIGGQISAVADTERSFAIFSQSGDGWEYSGPVTAEGPIVNWTNVTLVGGQVAVLASSYPKVSPDGDSRGPSKFWSRHDGTSFEPMTGSYLPGDVSSWVANDTIEVALDAGAADPNDDVYGGPTGATMAWTRQLPDGAWSDQEMILTGAGGDYLEDIARLDPGFVGVGYRVELGADQIYTGEPVVMEYLDGVWASASLPPLGGTTNRLYRVVGTPGGRALAVGDTNDPDLAGPLALVRSGDGVWTRVDLPVNDPGAWVINLAVTDDRFEVLIADGGTYAVLNSIDGVTFERNDLQFADPYVAKPAATARIDGVTYVVGVAGYAGARKLAVWALEVDGTLTPIDVVGDAPVGDIVVDSVVVNGADIWVGGQYADLGLVWKLNVSGMPASTEAPATTVAPVPTTAPPTGAPSTVAPPPTTAG